MAALLYPFTSGTPGRIRTADTTFRETCALSYSATGDVITESAKEL